MDAAALLNAPRFTWTDDEFTVTQSGDQTASSRVHEFCRNPLHPGPCKGWKQAKAAGRDTSIAHPDVAPAARRSRARKAAPAAPSSGDLAGLLRSPLVSQRPLGGGMMGETDLLQFADGKAVRKTFERSQAVRDTVEQADAEQLAVLVSRAAGVPAPQVVRTKPDEIHMEHIEGPTGSDVVDWGQNVPPGLPDTDEGVLLGLVDALLANTDRNPGNYILREDGKIKAAIDHGSAFYDDMDAILDQRIMEGNPFAARYFQPEGDGSGWAPTNDMSPADMAIIRKRLDGLRSDFEELGRGDWWQAMMDRMDILEKAASGTERRLP